MSGRRVPLKGSTMATIRRMRADDRVKSGAAAPSLGLVTVPANPAAGGTIYRLYPKADFKNTKVFQVFRLWRGLCSCVEY
jgi:hypothetical protein